MGEQPIYQSSERDIYNANNLNNNFYATIGQQFVSGLFPNSTIINLQYQHRPLNTNIPSYSFTKAHRVHTVQSFINILTTTPIFHIHGGVGIGKTQLALLIAESSKRNTYWFQLREYKIDNQLFGDILQTISSITNIHPSPSQNTYTFLESAIQKLSGSLFVFDDLLRFQNESSIAELISSICTIAPKYDLRLIITSNFEPSFRFREKLGSQYNITQAPLFTDQEIIELFVEHGASNMFLSQFMNLIIVTTNRHPLLLMAMISYLKQCDWEINYDNVSDLFAKKYAIDINSEIQDLVSKTVSGKDKEMLYRLSLFGNSFADQDILEISNVNPAIAYPQESINNLIGIWLQRDSATTYSISPLISDLGKKNLAINIFRKIHDTIARSILKKKSLSSFEGLRTITHFVSAEKYQDAAFILLSMLNSFISSKSIKKDDWGVTGLWYNIPLPSDLQNEVKILLRLAQIEACEKIGKDYNYLLEDLTQLSKSLSSINGFTGSLAAIATLKLFQINFDLAIYFFQIAIRCKNIDIQANLPSEISWESIIWILPSSINSPVRLKTWLQTFNMFSEEQLRSSEKGIIFKQAFTVVADRVWLSEHKKPKHAQNWDQVLAVLSELEKIAILKNSLLLWAAAIRAQAIVLAEYKKDVKNAVRIAQEALKLAPDNNYVKFLLSEVIGREYTIAKQYDKAIPWFETIFDMDNQEFVNDCVDSFILASEAAGEFDAKAAVKYTAKSVTLALENPEIISKHRLIQSLAEHTIALWLANGIQESFKTYEATIEHLFSSKDNSKNWKSLFASFGHVSGYLSAIAHSGNPPKVTSNKEIYASPKRGMFRCFNPEAANFHDASNEFLLCVQVSMFAADINNFESAEKWAIKAYDMGYGKSSNTGLLFESPPALIRIGRLVEAFRLLEDIFAFAHAAIISQNTTGKLNNVQEILGNKPNDNWDIIESQIAFHVVLPIFIKIITLRLLDIDNFEHKLSEFVDELNRIKATASSPNFWDIAIHISLSLKNDSYPNNEFTNFEGDYKKVLHVMSYLIFALRETPQRMIQYLLAVLPTIYEQLTRNHRLLIPLFADFMRLFAKKVFSEKRFFFSTPNLVEEELNSAFLLPDQKVTAKILNTLAFGLNISIPETAKEFIKKHL